MKKIFFLITFIASMGLNAQTLTTEAVFDTAYYYDIMDVTHYFYEFHELNSKNNKLEFVEISNVPFDFVPVQFALLNNTATSAFGEGFGEINASLKNKTFLISYENGQYLSGDFEKIECKFIKDASEIGAGSSVEAVSAVSCKTNRHEDEYYEVTTCTYRNIIVESTLTWSPMTAWSHTEVKYYLMNGNIKAEAKLKELFNDKSSELLNFLNQAFQAQFDSLKHDQDASSCLQDVGGFSPFSLDQIMMSFREEGVAYFSVSLGLMGACAYCNFLEANLSLNALDKYLK